MIAAISQNYPYILYSQSVNKASISPYILEFIRFFYANSNRTISLCINKVVMASANRIIGSVEEIEEVRSAIDASGVTIETLDGTYEDITKSECTCGFLPGAGRVRRRLTYLRYRR